MTIIPDFSLESNSRNQDLLIVEDGLTQFLQEIDIVFSSYKNEFISDQSIGRLNIEDLLNQRTIGASNVIAKAKYDIDNNTLGAATYKYDINVRFMKGNQRDIVLIDTIVYDNKQEVTQTYIFK